MADTKLQDLLTRMEKMNREEGEKIYDNPDVTDEDREAFYGRKNELSTEFMDHIIKETEGKTPEELKAFREDNDLGIYYENYSDLNDSEESDTYDEIKICLPNDHRFTILPRTITDEERLFFLETAMMRLDAAAGIGRGTDERAAEYGLNKEVADGDGVIIINNLYDEVYLVNPVEEYCDNAGIDVNSITDGRNLKKQIRDDLMKDISGNEISIQGLKGDDWVDDCSVEAGNGLMFTLEGDNSSKTALYDMVLNADDRKQIFDDRSRVFMMGMSEIRYAMNFQNISERIKGLDLGQNFPTFKNDGELYANIDGKEFQVMTPDEFEKYCEKSLNSQTVTIADNNNDLDKGNFYGSRFTHADRNVLLYIDEEYAYKHDIEQGAGYVCLNQGDYIGLNEKNEKFTAMPQNDFNKDYTVEGYRLTEEKQQAMAKKVDRRYHENDPYTIICDDIRDRDIETSARITLGVVSGYGIDNPSPEKAMKLAETTLHEAASVTANHVGYEITPYKYSFDNSRKPENADERTKAVLEHVEMKPALTEYRSEWGCPAGGETCVQVDIDEMNKTDILYMALYAQECLAQSTVTINFGDGESLYITEGGKEIKLFQDMQFDIPLKGDNAQEAGKAMQEALDKCAEKQIADGTAHDMNDALYATGAVVTEKDGSLHYVGSQNMLFGNVPEEQFKKVLDDTLDLAGVAQEKDISLETAEALGFVESSEQEKDTSDSAFEVTDNAAGPEEIDTAESHEDHEAADISDRDNDL